MSVKVAAWNVQEGLAEAERMPRIVKQVEQFDADVIVLSDAYSLDNELHGSQPDVLREAETGFSRQGYWWYGTEYCDSDPWHHDRNLVVLNRLPLVAGSFVRLATRNAVELKVQDPCTDKTLHIVGAHFDDRSEAVRLRQAAAFLKHVDVEQPTVLAGDLNSVHALDLWPRMLGSNIMRFATNYAPAARARSIGKRLVEMSSGGSLAMLATGGFRDADPLHRPSFPAKRSFLQLDHILLSEAAIAYHTRLVGQPDASDHRSVISTVSIQ